MANVVSSKNSKEDATAEYIKEKGKAPLDSKYHAKIMTVNQDTAFTAIDQLYDLDGRSFIEQRLLMVGKGNMTSKGGHFKPMTAGLTPKRHRLIPPTSPNFTAIVNGVAQNDALAISKGQ
jgi:hypothetical protein